MSSSISASTVKQYARYADSSFSSSPNVSNPFLMIRLTFRSSSTHSLYSLLVIVDTSFLPRSGARPSSQRAQAVKGRRRRGRSREGRSRAGSRSAAEGPAQREPNERSAAEAGEASLDGWGLCDTLREPERGGNVLFLIHRPLWRAIPRSAATPPIEAGEGTAAERRAPSKRGG